jgi:hypothetical protein
VLVFRQEEDVKDIKDEKDEKAEEADWRSGVDFFNLFVSCG